MRIRRIRRLKPKKIKGRIRVLKALPYKGNMVYIRQIDNEIFEYMLIFKEKIYSSYMVIKPRVGQTKLNMEEISQCSALLWAGAEATIDSLLGIKLDNEVAKKVKEVEQLERVLN